MEKMKKDIFEMSMDEIREMLAENRKKRNVSIEKVAALCGVSSQTVRNVEAGTSYNTNVVYYEMIILDDDEMMCNIIKRFFELCEQH